MKPEGRFLVDCIVGTFCAIAIICCILGLFKSCIEDKEQTSSPVEELMIDSLKQDNTKLVIEVEQLDSIKNVKVIEVKSLDNDSTIKLFYQLIGK